MSREPDQNRLFSHLLPDELSDIVLPALAHGSSRSVAKVAVVGPDNYFGGAVRRRGEVGAEG